MLGLNIWVIAVSVLLSLPKAWSEEKDGGTVIKWIDSRGKLLKLDWKVKNKMIWTESKDKEVPRLPAFRIQIEYPKDLEVVKTSQENDLTFVKDTGSSHVLFADTVSGSGSGTVHVQNKEGKKQQVGVVLFQKEGKNMLIDDTCTRSGIRLDEKKQGNFLFFAMDCVAQRNAVEVFIHRSKDAKFSRGTLPKGKSGKGWSHFQIALKKEKTKKGEKEKPIDLKEKKIGNFKIRPSGGGKVSEFDLYWDPSRMVELNPEGFYFAPSLGYSSISYTETGVNPIQISSLTLKVDASYWFSSFSDWNIGGNVFMNVIPFSASGTTTNPSFFGANLRVGYHLPFLKYPWSLNLSFGGFFYSVLGTENQYGFAPLFYPQFYPVLSYFINSKNRLNLYLKYVPLKRGFTVFDANEKELAMGMSWAKTLKNGHPLIFAIDYSSMAFQLATSVNANVSTFSLSAGYGF